MIIFTNLLFTIAEIIHFLIDAYIIVIFIACILSFVNPDPYNKIVQIIYRLTNPAFKLVRKIIPTTFAGIDIAPIVIWIVLILVDKLIAGILIYVSTKI